MFDSVNWVYAGIAAGGAVLSTALYALRLKMQGKRVWIAPLTLVLSAAFGFVLSKLVFEILLQATYLSVHGFPVSYPYMAAWSFFGLLLGVYLGVWVTGKIVKEDAGFLLELFAPAGMLLIAVMRAAEFTLGQTGLGELVENTAVQFFPVCYPVAMWGRSTWYMAVFAWETVWALLLMVLCLFRQRRHGVRGSLGLSMTLFYFCLGQILFESLRAECIRLGFVRLEQVISAVVCLVLVLLLCVKAKKHRFIPRFLPALLILAGIGAMVALEFALDEASFVRWVVYVLIILTLVLMGLVYFWAEKRVRKTTSNKGSKR